MQKKKQPQPNYALTKKTKDSPKAAPTPKAKPAPTDDSKYFKVGKHWNFHTGYPDTGF